MAARATRLATPHVRNGDHGRTAHLRLRRPIRPQRHPRPGLLHTGRLGVENRFCRGHPRPGAHQASGRAEERQGAKGLLLHQPVRHEGQHARRDGGGWPGCLDRRHHRDTPELRWTTGAKDGLEGFLAPQPSLQSALEYTWHELLHLTVPFTHGRADQVGIMAIPGTDNGKWCPLMMQVGNELPPQGTDPITGRPVTFQRPFSSRGCACGLA